jgi:cytochrome bd-type quinol oxidase subunit 1
MSPSPESFNSGGAHRTAILANASWMQTPQGYQVVNGQFMPTDWLAIIFTPRCRSASCNVMGATYLQAGAHCH